MREKLSVHDLLVRQVAALVSATADTITLDGENPLKIEAELYNHLAINCAEKGELAKAFAGWVGQPTPSAGGKG